MKNMRFFVIAVAMFFIVTSCLSAQSAETTHPSLIASPSPLPSPINTDIPHSPPATRCDEIAPSRKIAFRTFADENYISIIHVDGSYDYQHIVTGATFSWSPDGTSLAFASNKNGDLEIFRIEADGENLTQLTNSVGEDSWPVWSPDGMWMAFASVRDGNFQVWTMNSADGTNLKRLTSSTEPNPYVLVWLPHSRRIIFARLFTSGPKLYSMDEDGGDQKQLQIMDLPDGVVDISWSPDEQKIAFATQIEGQYEVFIANADGSNMTRLTNNAANDYSPSWSSDGCFITFHSDRDGQSEIYLMTVDGTDQTRLTHGMDNSFSPKFQP